MSNNTTHRPATIQRIRIGADADGKITAIAHESWSGDLPGGKPETAINQTRCSMPAPNRLTAMRLAVLDLPEGNAMRAPGEAPGHDGARDRHGRDGREAGWIRRSRSERYAVVPTRRHPRAIRSKPGEAGPSAFSQRHLVRCLRAGAERFGWDKRNPTPGAAPRRTLAGRHGHGGRLPQQPADEVGARACGSSGRGVVTVETDMTDIGTGSYTIIAQTAAEMMGVPIGKVVGAAWRLRLPGLGRLGRPVGRQLLDGRRLRGLREAAGSGRAEARLQLARDAMFADGQVRSATAAVPLAEAARDGELVAEDTIEYGDLDKTLPAIDLRRPFRRGRRSTPPPARSACAACWPSAPPAASSTRRRRAAR